MRLLVACTIALWGACGALASPQTDQLLDAMGVPALVRAFADDGQAAGANMDLMFLNGQGGDVWAETVRRLYDPVRLDQELRAAVGASLDDDTAAQALLFFESDLGRRIVTLEVEARRAVQDEQLEAMARAAPAANSPAISEFLAVRDLIARNTDAAMAAQQAFFDGLAAVVGRSDDTPDLESERDIVGADTESWLRGYYALAQSPLSADDVAIYTAFWDTDVGQTVDAALFRAFADSYRTLSYGLGQAVGRLLPQNEL